MQLRGITLESLGREDVTAYLKENLHWRITDVSFHPRKGDRANRGQLEENIIPKEDMPSLKVSVAMGRATHFIAADIPSRYENYEVLYEVSEGRLAGAAPGDLD